MVSSRTTGTNENISTFGDGTRNFQSIQTWYNGLAANTSSSGTMVTEVLECYNDGGAAFAQTLTASGGTRDATYPLIIRAAPGQENKWSNTNGFRITGSGAASAFFDISEAFVYIQDIGFTGSFNSASDLAAIEINADNAQVVGCNFFDLTNSGAGEADGLFNNGFAFPSIVNCQACSNSGNGFRTGEESQDSLFYNNTAGANGAAGFFLEAGDEIVKNNISGGNTGLDYNDAGVAAASTTNASSDLSAPGSSPLTSAVFGFISVANCDLRLGSTASDGFEDGTDLSADGTFPFDDDIDDKTRTVPWSMGGGLFASLAKPTISQLNAGRAVMHLGDDKIYIIVNPVTCVYEIKDNRPTLATGREGVGLTSGNTGRWVKYTYQEARTTFNINMVDIDL